MKRELSAALVSAVFLGAAAHAPVGAKTTVTRATVTKADIQALDDRFGAAVRAGDVSALAALYATDATVLPAGAPQVSGRDAIQAYWRQGLTGLADARLTASQVQPLGSEYAQEIGTFALKTKGTPGGTLTGKYVVIWKHEAGGWKLWTDIWNSDQS